ncbi:hypothetical protein [Nocardia sp. NPDC052566]|uniref:hypothetical protein n=1 Tax=Nocardia sp. NPDC052566 TaxID=3364330 RepID=UPI0037CB5D63
MNLLTDLAARVPSRWLIWQGLPGLIFLGVAVVGGHLGYRAAIDRYAAVHYLSTLAERADRFSTAEMAIAAALVVVLAAAVGQAAAAVAIGVELVVLRRRTRLTSALRRMEEQFRTHYLLDVATVWPHLWLQLPQEHRDSAVAARTRIRLAATTIGWGLLTACIAAVWPPAWLPTLLVLAVGCMQLRLAIAGYARTISAMVRRYTPPLATALGVDHDGLLNRALGRALQYHLQFDEMPRRTGR